jgi:hypothetical protein
MKWITAVYHAPLFYTVKFSLRKKPEHPYHKISGPTEWSKHLTAIGREYTISMWVMIISLVATISFSILIWRTA